MTRPWFLLVGAAALLWVLLAEKRYRARGVKALVTRCARVALVLVMTLALCGVSVPMGGSERVAWFLLDASASMGDAGASARAAIADALSTMPKNTKVGVIAFGENAMVETALSDAGGYAGQAALIDAGGSDLDAALRLASGLTPTDASARFVVLTDGRVSADELAAVSARGVSLTARIIDAPALQDAQMVSVALPRAGYEGQSFTVTITVRSNLDTTARLVLYANREVAALRDVTLRKGENTFAFQTLAQTTGVVAYEAQVVASGDEVSENDRAGGYIVVSGRPSLLMVEGKAGDGDALASMLKAVGMRCERVAPQGLRENADALRAYDSILLCNVDADSLSAEQTAALSTAVRQLGRGLCVFGGDSAYALGGYRGSALEELLPVTVDVRNKLHMPSLALMLVIDKSGSMTEGQFGTTRLELAKQAAMLAAEVLTSNDEIGVIAFDDTAKWVVEPQKVEDVAEIQRLIGTIRPGGGTAFYTALSNAYTALHESSAQQRHVIFLTDGEPGDGGFETIVGQMAREGITLTAVAVGGGANATRLRRLAEIGGGRMYATNEFDNVPKIFTKETMLVSGSYVRNRVFTPALAAGGLFDGYAGFPTLSGYLATTEKSLATVEMWSDLDEPLLAWWRYGAGTSLCWTSDVSGGWTSAFMGWEDCARFFGDMISHTLPKPAMAGELRADADEISFTPDDAEGGQYTAEVLAPDGQSLILPLEETAPGQYTASWEPDGEGAYTVAVTRGGERLAEGGYVQSYASEYDMTAYASADAFVEKLEQAGGQVLQAEEALLGGAWRDARARREWTQPLLLAALILFVLDVALRRLSWERLLQRFEQSRAGAQKRGGERVKNERKPERRRKTNTAAQGNEPERDTADELIKAMQSKKKL